MKLVNDRKSLTKATRAFTLDVVEVLDLLLIEGNCLR